MADEGNVYKDRESIVNLEKSLSELGFNNVSVHNQRTYSVSFDTSPSDEKIPVSLFIYINKELPSLGGTGLRFTGCSLVSENKVGHKYSLILDRVPHERIDYDRVADEIFNKLPSVVRSYNRRREHH